MAVAVAVAAAAAKPARPAVAVSLLKPPLSPASLVLLVLQPPPSCDRPSDPQPEALENKSPTMAHIVCAILYTRSR